MILNMFLFFDDFEPSDSYKDYSYKKQTLKINMAIAHAHDSYIYLKFEPQYDS